MPGPGAGAGLGFGLQQAGMGVGQALMQASMSAEDRQLRRRQEEEMRAQRSMDRQRLRLAETTAADNREWRERQLDIEESQRQRTQARYVADRIRQEGRYADTLRLQGVEPQVMPGISEMPMPQMAGPGAALMDATRTHRVPEESALRIPSVSAPRDAASQNLEYLREYTRATERPRRPYRRFDPDTGQIIDLETGEVFQAEGYTPEPDYVTAGGRRFEDTPEGREESLEWLRTRGEAARKPEEPTDALMRQILGDETGGQGGAPDGSPFRLTPEVPGGRLGARASEPGEGGETLAQQRASWDAAAAYIRANPEDYDDQSPEEVLGPRP